MFRTNDRVGITTSEDGKIVPLAGKITRVWDKPQADPYITVKTDDGRTFVRCASKVTCEGGC